MRTIISVGFAVLLGILLLGYVVTTIDRAEPVPTSPNPVQSNTIQGDPAFTWQYETSENQDGIPETKISIAAIYLSGTITRKDVDTVEGNCNEYTETNADMYENSTMIICYYAGLGRYFKVVKSDGSYLVQRRIFEEASPDYNPPVTKFETITTF